MITSIVSILVALSQLFTSFALSVTNTQLKDIDYGGTKYVAPVISE